MTMEYTDWSLNLFLPKNSLDIGVIFLRAPAGVQGSGVEVDVVDDEAKTGGHRVQLVLAQVNMKNSVYGGFWHKNSCTHYSSCTSLPTHRENPPPFPDRHLQLSLQLVKYIGSLSVLPSYVYHRNLCVVRLLLRSLFKVFCLLQTALGNSVVHSTKEQTSTNSLKSLQSYLGFKRRLGM